MATPVNDSYSAASGGVIAGGRYHIPTWVPPVGSIADVALNTMYDVRGTGTKTAGVLDDWCGIAYAPEYGEYGSLIGHGGGHSDSQENGIYRYDIATRTWTKIKGDASSYPQGDTYNADPTTGWMWQADGVSLQSGEPFATHNYAFLMTLPSTAKAGAPNGWLFTPGRASMPNGGSRGTNQSHKFALGVDSVWSLEGSPLLFPARHSWGIYDPVRNRVVVAYGDFAYRKLYTLDIATGTSGSLDFSADPFVLGYYQVGKYNALHDLYMYVRWQSGTTLNLGVIDPVPATARHYQPSVTGTPPASSVEGSWEWVEEWQSFVLFQSDSNTVYTLKAPANPRTGTWTWGSQTITGTVRPSLLDRPSYTRIRYVPQLDGFMWAARHNVPFQMFRISAP